MISVDPLARGVQLAKDLGLRFPVLADPQMRAIEAFGVKDAETGVSWPSAFVIDPAGTIRWRDLSETYQQRPKPALLFAALDAL